MPQASVRPRLQDPDIHKMRERWSMYFGSVSPQAPEHFQVLSPAAPMGTSESAEVKAAAAAAAISVSRCCACDQRCCMYLCKQGCVTRAKRSETTSSCLLCSAVQLALTVDSQLSLHLSSPGAIHPASERLEKAFTVWVEETMGFWNRKKEAAPEEQAERWAADCNALHAMVRSPAEGL